MRGLQQGPRRIWRRRSAVDPFLWLCLITTPVCSAIILVSTDETVRHAFLALTFLPICAAICACVYFMLKDPSRLQTEERRDYSPVVGLVPDEVAVRPGVNDNAA
jgi:hypothetical protein